MSEATPQPIPRPEIHGFPNWIKICGALLAVLVIVSAIRVAPVFRDAIVVERSHRHLAQGKYPLVADELRPVAKRYPQSIEIALDLAQAQVEIKEYPGAVRTLDSLQGRELSADQVARADALASRIEDAAKKLQGKAK